MNANKILTKCNRINKSGHVLVYRPSHFSSYKGGNWEGYVYEHRFIVECDLGRPLKSDEEIHHLDLNPADNRLENLMVIPHSSHMKLHIWLESGAPGYENPRQNGMNSGKPKLLEHVKRCKICDITLSNSLNTYCGLICYGIDVSKKSKRPELSQLKKDLLELSGNMCAVGRKYGVSDNAVRKWIKRFIAEGVWQS